LRLYQESISYGLLENELTIYKGYQSRFRPNKITAGMFITNDGLKGERFLNNFLPLFVRAIQQYLKSSLELETADPEKIAKENGKLLGERTVIFYKDNIQDEAEAALSSVYKFDAKLEDDADRYTERFSIPYEDIAVYLKVYNPYKGSWYSSIIDTKEARVLYLENDGAFGSMKKVSVDNLRDMNKAGMQ
jgi:hypothetical protein